jgi:hypothetical protein
LGEGGLGGGVARSPGQASEGTQGEGCHQEDARGRQEKDAKEKDGKEKENLILRSLRSKRLEGWQRAPPATAWFETRKMRSSP